LRDLAAPTCLAGLCRWQILFATSQVAQIPSGSSHAICEKEFCVLKLWFGLFAATLVVSLLICGLTILSVALPDRGLPDRGLPDRLAGTWPVPR
jgi:hypothetical protein